MTVIGIAMVKDEADIIAITVRHMLTQVDHVIIADNGSSDGTRDILTGLDVELVDDPDPAYYQSAKMGALAARAHEQGATWIVPFDADELWTCRWGTISDVLAAHEADYGIVTAELFDHVATGEDLDEPDPVRRMPWRRANPLPLPKVACRAALGLVIEQGNHWATYPIPARATASPAFSVHHYAYRSPEQVIRKVRNGAAAYAATTGLPAEVGAHWRQWATWSDEQLTDLFYTWYWRKVPWDPVVIDGEEQGPLVYDPQCPRSAL